MSQVWSACSLSRSPRSSDRSRRFGPIGMRIRRCSTSVRDPAWSRNAWSAVIASAAVASGFFCVPVVPDCSFEIGGEFAVRHCGVDLQFCDDGSGSDMGEDIRDVPFGGIGRHPKLTCGEPLRNEAQPRHRVVEYPELIAHLSSEFFSPVESDVHGATGGLLIARLGPASAGPSAPGPDDHGRRRARRVTARRRSYRLMRATVCSSPNRQSRWLLPMEVFGRYRKAQQRGVAVDQDVSPFTVRDGVACPELVSVGTLTAAAVGSDGDGDRGAGRCVGHEGVVAVDQLADVVGGEVGLSCACARHLDVGGCNVTDCEEVFVALDLERASDSDEPVVATGRGEVAAEVDAGGVHAEALEPDVSGDVAVGIGRDAERVEFCWRGRGKVAEFFSDDEVDAQLREL